MKYFTVAVTALVLLLEFFRLINTIFQPSFLKHKIFQFPKDKWTLVGYHLCAMLLLVIFILVQLDLI